MDETNFSASTEASAPEASSVSAPASASDSGASSQPISSTTPDATPTGDASSAESLSDIGYSLDDLGLEPSEAAEHSTEEDNYSDEALDALSKEPGLDPAKTPGLVERIRQIREQNRLHRMTIAEKEAAYRETQAQLEALSDFGGVEGAKEILGVFTPLLRNEPEAASNLLTQIWENATPAYAALVDGVLQHTTADYLVQRLTELGKLPDSFSSPAAAPPVLDADTLAQIPEHLRGVAQQLAIKSPAVLEDLLLQPDEVRNHHLEREKRFADMEVKEQEQARADWNSKVQAAQTAAIESIQKLSADYEQRHYTELAKWKPFGEDAAANQRLHRDILEGALSDLITQSEYRAMYEQAQQMLRDAPMLELEGQKFKADEYRRQAGQMAARFNVRLGQLMADRIKGENGYARVFEDARRWRDHQRSQVSPRTEVPGQTVATASRRNNPNDFNGQTRTSDGQMTPEFKAYLENLVQTSQ